MSENIEFFPIPIENLRIDSILSFDLYLKRKEKYVLYRNRKLKVTYDDIDNLVASKTKNLFIQKSERESYRRYIEKHIGNILSDERIPLEKKSRILYGVSTDLMRQAFSKNLSKETMERSYSLTSNTVKHLVKEPRGFHALLRLTPHDYYTYTHSINVSIYSIMLAIESGILEISKIEEIGLASLLHDIGKITIDSSILNKPGRLDEKEWEIIKKHPEAGATIARLIGKISPSVCEIIAQHHERGDGKGYPKGLSSSETLHESKIILIADIFDALTTNRSYSPAVHSFTALRFMKEEMRGSLDMDLLNAFVKLLGNPL